MRIQAVLIPLRKHGVGLFLASVLFFLLWPSFDLSMSQLLYGSGSHSFVWKNNQFADLVYSLTHAAGFGIYTVLSAALLASVFMRKGFLVKRRTALMFLLSVGILGPGLMVNVVLKGHWERPRPREAIEFGGEHEYQPPFLLAPRSDQGASFVSGHAAIGFYMFAFALLTRKRRWLWAAGACGAGIGAVRMAQGAHYFSDVIFSGWVVWFCSILLYKLFYSSRVITLRRSPMSWRAYAHRTERRRYRAGSATTASTVAKRSATRGLDGWGLTQFGPKSLNSVLRFCNRRVET